MRSFAPEVLALLDAGRIKFAGMIKIDLGEGSFGIIQSSADHTWNGVTFKSVPRGLVSVSPFEASTDTAATGFEIVVAESPDNGVTPTEIMSFENYDYADRPLTVYDLFVHPDTKAILGAPVAQLRGYIDTVQHAGGDGPHLMTIKCETRNMDFNRTNGRKNSREDQKRISATDEFFMNAANFEEIKWGRK